MNEQPQYKTVDKFDRMMGMLDSLPEVFSTKPATVVETTPMIGCTQTFILQTKRQIERDVNADGEEISRSKDTLFLQYIDDEGRLRLVIPAKAIDAIVRQRDALSSKVRKKIGREQAAARKARGELPGFMRNGKKAKADK